MPEDEIITSLTAPQVLMRLLEQSAAQGATLTGLVEDIRLMRSETLKDIADLRERAGKQESSLAGQKEKIEGLEKRADAARAERETHTKTLNEVENKLIWYGAIGAGFIIALQAIQIIGPIVGWF